MTPAINKDHAMKFPSFYEECAYNTGLQDARDGHRKGEASFIKWGEVQPVGMEWYNKGHKDWVAK